MLQVKHHLQKSIALTLAASILLVSNLGKAEAVSSSSENPNDLRRNALASYMEKKSLDPLNAFPSALVGYEYAIKVAVERFGKDSPYISNMHYEIGLLALDNASFLAASHHLGEAVRLNPNSVMARVKYAQTLDTQGHAKDALVQIQSALARNDRSPEAHAALVKWLAKHKQPIAAIRESAAVVNVMKPGAAKRSAPEKIAAIIPGLAPPKVVKPVEAPVVAPKVEPPKSKPANTQDAGPTFEPVNKSKNAPMKALSVMDILRKKVRSVAPNATPIVDSKKEAEEKAKQEKAKQEKAQQDKERQRQERERQEKQRQKDSAKKVKKTEKKRTRASDLVPLEPGGLQSLQPSMGVLKTTAKMKDKTKKKDEPKPEPKEPTPTENETPDSGQQVVPVQQQQMPSFTPPPPTKKQRHTGLVPPPPPMTPVFPTAPMPVMQPVKPIPVKPRKPPVVKQEDTSAEQSPPPASSGSSDDPEFLLQWAEVKKKPRGR